MAIRVLGAGHTGDSAEYEAHDGKDCLQFSAQRAPDGTCNNDGNGQYDSDGGELVCPEAFGELQPTGTIWAAAIELREPIYPVVIGLYSQWVVVAMHHEVGFRMVVIVVVFFLLGFDGHIVACELGMQCQRSWDTG